MLKSGRIPHALMFTGIDGVGKRTAALNLAMACNCQNSEDSSGYSCGHCSACVRIADGSHPDVTMIYPEGGVIKIAAIRELGRVFSMKPFEGRMRVGILVDSHLMNLSAGNALLKILEEPPEKTLFVLTARQNSDSLPTIASRCQNVRFNPVSSSILSHALIKRHRFGEDEASIIAAMSGGSFSRAISMKKTWISRRNWITDELMRLKESPFHLILALSEKLAKNRDILFEALEIMLSWFRDITVFISEPAKVINRDRLEAIREVSEKYTFENLIHSMNAIRAAQKNIEAKANARLAMDNLLFLLRQHQEANNCNCSGR